MCTCDQVCLALRKMLIYLIKGLNHCKFDLQGLIVQIKSPLIKLTLKSISKPYPSLLPLGKIISKP